MVTSDRLYGADFVGLSTDTKPTESTVPNGATFIEMDTGNVYMFDKQNNTWRAL